MILGRVKRVLARARSELRRSFTEEHSPRETAGSFSLGVFITMLPTLGIGLLLFFVLAWAFDRVNRIALFASAIVCNPVVKWGVYGASFALGTTILGPVPGVTRSAVSLSAGPGVVSRLLVGNLILAVVAAVVAYMVAFRFVSSYDHIDIPVTDALAEFAGDDGSGSPDDDAADPES